MTDTALGPALLDLASAITDALAQIALAVWDALEAHPQVQSTITGILLVGSAIWATVWFFDGLHNPRRKCRICRGRGNFTSKISSNRDRACRCCAGTGRHKTLPDKIWRKLRRKSA